MSTVLAGGLLVSIPILIITSSDGDKVERVECKELAKEAVLCDVFLNSGEVRKNVGLSSLDVPRGKFNLKFLRKNGKENNYTNSTQICGELWRRGLKGCLSSACGMRTSAEDATPECLDHFDDQVKKYAMQNDCTNFLNNGVCEIPEAGDNYKRTSLGGVAQCILKKFDIDMNLYDNLKKLSKYKLAEDVGVVDSDMYNNIMKKIKTSAEHTLRRNREFAGAGGADSGFSACIIEDATDDSDLNLLKSFVFSLDNSETLGVAVREQHKCAAAIVDAFGDDDVVEMDTLDSLPCDAGFASPRDYVRDNLFDFYMRQSWRFETQ